MLKRVYVNWLVVVLVITMVILTACGPSPDTETTTDTGDKGIIRFTFSPDPVWDYLSDSGIREEMEQACDVRILTATSWDDFGVYAGGHADIISVASWEVPDLVAESGQESVIFGKYNVDRCIALVPADSSAQSLEDVQGGSVAIWDVLGSPLLWGTFLKQLYGLDFRPEEGDWDIVLADIGNTAELAAKGDVDAALCMPDFSVRPLMSGRIRVLYDGKTSREMYEEMIGESHEGPMSNIFLARKTWFETHPDEIACFLAIWDKGLQGWKANKREIIASYPQHFAVESEEEIAWMADYLDQHDWFADSVYLDEEWVEGEEKLFDLMKEAGFMDKDQENPEFVVVSP